MIAGRFPDPSACDVVIQSGGENVFSKETWIENVIKFVRKTRAIIPKTKVCAYPDCRKTKT